MVSITQSIVDATVFVQQEKTQCNSFEETSLLTKILKRYDCVNRVQRETRIWTFGFDVWSFWPNLWILRRKLGRMSHRDSDVKFETGILLVPSSAGFKSVGT